MEERIESASEEGSRRPALQCFAKEVERKRGENVRRVERGLYPTRTTFHPRSTVQKYAEIPAVKRKLKNH